MRLSLCGVEGGVSGSCRLVECAATTPPCAVTRPREPRGDTGDKCYEARPEPLGRVDFGTSLLHSKEWLRRHR